MRSIRPFGRLLEGFVFFSLCDNGGSVGGPVAIGNSVGRFVVFDRADPNIHEEQIEYAKPTT